MNSKSCHFNIERLPKHSKFGSPNAFYQYAFADGTEGGICRFLVDGKKEIRPIRLDVSQNRWIYKAAPKPYPLFNLNNILSSSDKPILFHEGEKSALKGLQLLPEFVSTTTMFGARNPHCSDFNPVKDRIVFVLPDNDEAGKNYAKRVADLCIKAGASSVRVINYPKVFPEKWDLADELPEGISIDTIKQMIRLAPMAYIDAKLHDGFEIYKNNLCYRNSKEGKEDKLITISTPINVTAFVRDKNGASWGRLVQFRDQDYFLHELVIPAKSLHYEKSALINPLVDKGLTVEVRKESYDLLARFIASSKPQKKLIICDSVGWFQEKERFFFVFPKSTIGGSEVVFQVERDVENPYLSRGSLEEWKQNVGACCVGNSRLILSVCSGLVGPLLMPLCGESGGFHIYGPSSIGKSTAIHVAGSLWGGGGPNGFKKSWRATSNGIEALTSLHSDTFLPLDEVSQACPDMLEEMVFLIANGHGKSRANKDGQSQKRSQWRISCLSTGEHPIMDAMPAIKGKKSVVGPKVRIIDVSGEPTNGMGLFETIHHASNPAEFAKRLEDDSKKNFYGTLGPSFIELIVTRREEALDKLRHFKQQFLDQCDLDDATGQVRRVAERFALAAAAGEYAALMSLLPWRSNEAIQGCKICFEDYLSRVDKHQQHEDRQALDTVRSFLETFGDSKFSNLKTAYRDIKSTEKAGIVKELNGKEYYCIFGGCFKNEVCNGHSKDRVVRALDRAGFLLKGEGGRDMKKVRYGDKTMRFYCIDSGLLESDASGGNREQRAGNIDQVSDIVEKIEVPSRDKIRGCKDLVTY